jgi:hypothetical protein
MPWKRANKPVPRAAAVLPIQRLAGHLVAVPAVPDHEKVVAQVALDQKAVALPTARAVQMVAQLPVLSLVFRVYLASVIVNQTQDFSTLTRPAALVFVI